MAAAHAPALLVVLDGIEDPHNLGAILRTADAAGVDGVIRQARRSAPLDGAVGKTSAGAVAHLKIATVVNVTRAIEEIKEAGVWTVGLAVGRRPPPTTPIDLTVPTAIVVGAEGTGLRRLVREACDHVAAIPMAGRVVEPERLGGDRRSCSSRRSGSAAVDPPAEPVLYLEVLVGRTDPPSVEVAPGRRHRSGPAGRRRRRRQGRFDDWNRICWRPAGVLDLRLCPAGVAQPGRAADL